jgi:GNAT superfamily N-acetyltransferase
LFHDREQVGFARVVTDRATFAYLCDVYIVESHRGKGLSKWLVEAVMAHPDLQGLRRFQLVTRDAHGLYTRFDFRAPEHPDRHMEIFRHGMYLRKRQG